MRIKPGIALAKTSRLRASAARRIISHGFVSLGRLGRVSTPSPDARHHGVGGERGYGLNRPKIRLEFLHQVVLGQLEATCGAFLSLHREKRLLNMSFQKKPWASMMSEVQHRCWAMRFRLQLRLQFLPEVLDWGQGSVQTGQVPPLQTGRTTRIEGPFPKC